MSALKGQVVLLFGGTGTVGGGALKHLLDKDVHVVIPSRKQQNIDDLFEKHTTKKELIHPIVVDAGDRKGQEKVKEFIIETFGEDGLDHVISIHGGVNVLKPKTISEASTNDLKSSLESFLHPHHEAVQVFYPMLKKSKIDAPSFTIISGAAGEQLINLEWTLISVACAALYGIAMSLIVEAKERKDKVRVNDYRIGAWIVKEEGKEGAINNMDCGAALVSILESNARGQVFKPSTLEDFRKMTLENTM